MSLLTWAVGLISGGGLATSGSTRDRCLPTWRTPVSHVSVTCGRWGSGEHSRPAVPRTQVTIFAVRKQRCLDVFGRGRRDAGPLLAPRPVSRFLLRVMEHNLSVAAFGLDFCECSWHRGPQECGGGPQLCTGGGWGRTASPVGGRLQQTTRRQKESKVEALCSDGEHPPRTPRGPARSRGRASADTLAVWPGSADPAAGTRGWETRRHELGLDPGPPSFAPRSGLVLQGLTSSAAGGGHSGSSSLPPASVSVMLADSHPPV